MAQIAVSVAIGLASIAISYLLPMPKIKNEGPRLNDLNITSASYGKFIYIIFGTDRVDGNIIETTDPAIEEESSVESQRAGKGGGSKSKTTVYRYYFTGSIAFCASGDARLVRLWADGKIIVDNTVGAGQQVKPGVSYIFYPGGEDQEPDPEENTRRDGFSPAYRHLVRIKFNRLPLEDFGNRLPNFTAEISFNSTPGFDSTSADLPATAISDGAQLTLDPYTRRVIRLPFRTGSAGNAFATTADLDFVSMAGLNAFSSMAADWQGRTYGGNGSANTTALRAYDATSGAQLWALGRAGNDVAEYKTGGIINFLNSNHWVALTCLNTPYGAQSIVMHYGEVLSSSFSLVYADGVPTGADAGTGIDETSSTWNSVLIASDNVADMPGGTDAFTAVIPDHDRGCFYCIMAKAGDDEVWRIDFNFQLWAFPEVNKTIMASYEMTQVGTLTYGDPGDDFPTSGNITGWAVNRLTGDLILSNGTTVLLYDPASDQVLATTELLPGFNQAQNYYSGNTMGYMRPDTNDNRAIWFDARTLVKLQELTDASDPLLNFGSLTSSVWDDHDQAIIATHPDQQPRIRKFFLGRVNVDGVPLPDVVEALCTEYLGLPMGGLVPDDLNLDDLAGEMVWGYTLNNRSRLRDALDPLQTRYLFDTIQSDWKLKCVKRGGAVVASMPSRLVGALVKSATGAQPAVKETRVQDNELPLRVNVQYRNRDFDYGKDMEHDKRQWSPLRTMNSLTELTVELPLADYPTPMKQLASKLLFTAWHERRRLESIVPWQFLYLDPSDVIEINAFGETLRTRIDKWDTGANWSIDMLAAIEDSRTYDSSIDAGDNLGYIPQPIGSDLQPRLMLIDAPQLLITDSRPEGTTSVAYAAMIAQGDDWPGGTIYRSQDGSTFNPISGTSTEALAATIRTPPGAFGYNAEGDFPNHWQEVADGGQIIVAPIRNVEAWATATEIAVMNGANAIAVVTAGGVEIIQFQTVTLNSNGTLTLDRLLRGRLGTEDIADAATIATGDVVILIADQNAAPYMAAIMPTNLGVAQLGQTLLYKGVTNGTYLEDAQTQGFIYSGRDLRPYSPVHVSYAYDGGADELDVTWDRRVRGPGIGELIDGNGEVLLGESIERFRVTLIDAAGAQVAEEDIDDAEAITLTGITALPSGGDARIEVRQIGGTGLASPPGFRPL